MNTVLKNANVFIDNKFKKSDICISNGLICKIEKSILPDGDAFVYDFNNRYIFPGFTDVHVHLREPGFSYKETIKSGTMAAVAGGYTNVFTMPNLIPVPDSPLNLKKQLEIIEKDAIINVYPFGACTIGEKGELLSDMEGLSNDVIGFSDDGKGIQSELMMKSAMKTAKALDKIISAHCEENSLLSGGYVHDGEFAKQNGYKGICSESEWSQVRRDIKLAKETGCKYHVCHISTEESVELIRRAKAGGVDITCETAPHYLVMNDMMIKNDGRYKMNPPIRSEEDRLALIEGIKDETIDMIATDHAPHSADEKSGGLKESLNGIVGLETSFSVLYTELVKKKIISLERLINLMCINPCRRFGLRCGIKLGLPADLTVFNLDDEFIINSEKFFSKGKSTPFESKNVFGKCILTMVKGKTVWKSEVVL